jgi:hypothetical protein
LKPLLHSLLILTLLASGLVQAQVSVWSGLVSGQSVMNSEPANEDSPTSEPRSKKAHHCRHQTAKAGHLGGSHADEAKGLTIAAPELLESAHLQDRRGEENRLSASDCPHQNHANGHCSSSNCLCCASAFATCVTPSSLTQSVTRQLVFPSVALCQSAREPFLALLKRPPILIS